MTDIDCQTVASTSITHPYYASADFFRLCGSVICDLKKKLTPREQECNL